MNMGLAPRPANEDLRAQTVIKTGLIDAPNPDLFQIYCDLAKDITGFATASFSLYDGEMKCAIAEAGSDDFVVGSKSERSEWNICSYVLLETEPLIMEDIKKDPKWQHHPNMVDLEVGPAYAGFPVINGDNFALGTLCMLNPTPKKVNNDQIMSIKKITKSIAHLLDLQLQQKELTSQRMLEALMQFQRECPALDLHDFRTYISLCSEMRVNADDSAGIIEEGLVEHQDSGEIVLTEAGRLLQVEMKLQQKPVRRIKMDGSQADAMIDEMFAEIE